MAYGYEVILVLNRDIVTRYALAFLDTDEGREHLQGYPDNRDFIASGFEDDPYQWEQVAVDYMNGVVEPGISRAHAELIRERFDENAVYNDENEHYLLAETPEGRREFALFNVGYFGAENQEPPRTYGISLWGRYFPTWLDWRHLGGGSNEVFIMDDETQRMIAAARGAIQNHVPEILDAPLGVVFQHY